MPAGPLAVRWLTHDIPPPKAGTIFHARVELENAGMVAWSSEARIVVNLSYHWLDGLGNPIVWEGQRTPLPGSISPGDAVAVDLRVAAPTPPATYRLGIDLVAEGRFWFAELGNERLELDLDVAPRLTRRALAVRLEPGPGDLAAATNAALARQEEPLADEGEAVAFLAPGCVPAPDWSRRVLDAHDEGFAAVAGSVEVKGGLLERRRLAAPLAPWAPGFGRAPTWSLPLLCPSLVRELADAAPWTERVAGLPALDQAMLAEPWICDGRIRLAIAARALRQADRRPA